MRVNRSVSGAAPSRDRFTLALATSSTAIKQLSLRINRSRYSGDCRLDSLKGWSDMVWFEALRPAFTERYPILAVRGRWSETRWDRRGWFHSGTGLIHDSAAVPSRGSTNRGRPTKSQVVTRNGPLEDPGQHPRSVVPQNDEASIDRSRASETRPARMTSQVKISPVTNVHEDIVSTCTEPG